MNHGDASALLGRFASEGDEEAFRTLVNQSVTLVYSAALRQSRGDSHLAEEITQSVFTLLARKAGSLRGHPTITGWLFTATRLCARAAVRASERRRQLNTDISAMPEPTSGDYSDSSWSGVKLVIDDAMHRLNARDREGILLRFFENRPYSEIGSVLNLSENTARMRVERALEKLRIELRKRGITSTSAALASVLVSHTAVAAPVYLSGQIAANVLASASIAGAGGAGLWTTLTIMNMSKISSVVAVVALGVALYQGTQARRADQRTAEASSERAVLQNQVDELQRRLAVAENRARAADEDNAHLIAGIAHMQQSAAAQRPVATPASKFTRAQVDQRFQRAKELARTGDPAEALEEYLWCYDIGMARLEYFGIRNVELLSEIAKLGEAYPAALDALRQRRNAAATVMQADPNDYAAIHEFASLCKALKEDGRLVDSYVALPVGDPRRLTMLGVGALEMLVSAHRYSEVARSKPFDYMIGEMDMMAAIHVPDATPNAAKARQSIRENVVRTAANNFEVLVGAGDTTNAEALAKKLFAYDNTPATKAIFAERAARAGRPQVIGAVISD